MPYGHLVIMYKLILILAVVANVISIVSSTDSCIRCKKNEEYFDCINGGCEARNCSQLGNDVPCPKLRAEDCIEGCICSDGYLRADNGTCIKKEKCRTCGGDPNAVSGCGVFCQRCSNYGTCPLNCKEFCKKNACECKPGYIYDDNTKKCVCPGACTPTCKDHEVYSDCTNSGCDAQKCSQLGFQVPCVRLSSEACIKGCICEPGYVRADNGTCIPKKECPSCGGDKNAESGCGGFCKQCKGDVPCKKICKLNGCECKVGYVYDPNVKKCVKQKDCTPTCKVNEVYSNCTNRVCDARNCSQLGFEVSCVEVDPKACIKGCICQPDYVRADNGTCIPKSECPSCGGDNNAKFGCGVFCTQCKGEVPCPRICKPNSCDCKPGYVYDPNVKKCVLQKDCTPTCDKEKNEVYSGCINGYCGYRKCSQLGGPMICVDPPLNGCIGGCICANGYLRADNGTCLLKEDCPCGGDPNAQSGCGTFCTRCSNYNDGPVACKVPCKSFGCECREGYIYDDVTMKCVLPENCSPEVICEKDSTT